MKNQDFWSISYINTVGFPQDKLKLHSHTFNELSLIVRGDIKYVSDNMNTHVQGKSLIFSKAYQLHNPYVSQDKPYERYQIAFGYDLIDDKIANKLLATDSFIVSLTEEDFEELYCYIHQLYVDSDAANEESFQKRYFLLNAVFTKIIQLHQTLKPAGPLTKTYINDVLVYLEQAYAEKIMAEELASRFFVSRSKLFQDFHKQTGITLSNYINMIRVKNAKNYLQQGYSVTYTAELCGFANSGHFIKVFSSYNGTTPLKYQQSCGLKHMNDKTPNPL